MFTVSFGLHLQPPPITQTMIYRTGDSTCGQRALYQSGMTGIPIYNVNNNCATGSSALHLAYQFVRGGSSDCALALGFEKMEKGSLGSKVRISPRLSLAFIRASINHAHLQYDDRTNPIDKHGELMIEVAGFEPAPPAPQVCDGWLSPG